MNMYSNQNNDIQYSSLLSNEERRNPQRLKNNYDTARLKSTNNRNVDVLGKLMTKITITKDI